MTDTLQSLDLNPQSLPSDLLSASRVGDSGYVSFPGALPIPFGHFEQYSRIAESDVDNDDGSSNATQIEVVDIKASDVHDKYVNLETGGKFPETADESAMSVVSSATFLDDKDRDLSSDSWKVPTPQVLEQLSRTGKKGSMRSEVQLRCVGNE